VYRDGATVDLFKGHHVNRIVNFQILHGGNKLEIRIKVRINSNTRKTKQRNKSALHLTMSAKNALFLSTSLEFIAVSAHRMSISRRNLCQRVVDTTSFLLNSSPVRSC
jgi:hypothetical protein